MFQLRVTAMMPIIRTKVGQHPSREATQLTFEQQHLKGKKVSSSYYQPYVL